ncbi:hypothetical protein JOF29_007322 [Kribbella aluminosa]|uniref:Major capsid protein n=1 Tax=Kribbella aluminosa TaxID=416017 RepID=A0ABS4UX41_9ACTN|nr:hypothetical protein [Kribbella aluminosa]MBP2356212.1 hypothetical protein [Kribbella aluminosa]
MALRTPIYLDAETLFAQAEYHDLAVPQQAEIVEKTTNKRSASGNAAFPGVGGASAGVGRDVELQSTYTLTPSHKATVSKLIDSLIKNGEVKVNPDGNTPLGKDDLVELDGRTRITAASLAGKMFHIIRRLTDGISDVDGLTDLDADSPEVAAQLKQVYLQNELLPIPILLEMTETGLPQKAYVSLRPSHFVELASADRVERELRVLGTVTHLVDDSPDGYFSAEEWLLHGYEYLFRRLLMTQVNDVVKKLVNDIGLDLPANDVHGFIAGPAIVVDGIAVY